MFDEKPEMFCKLLSNSSFNARRFFQIINLNLNNNKLISSPRNISFTSTLQTDDTSNNNNAAENDNDDSVAEKIRVHYITNKGEKITVEGTAGDNVMYLAQKNSIDIEGACEASLACCTCHVYVRDDYFDKIPEASEEEEDLLDMAPFLKSNSRLSCQIILKKDLQDIQVTLPPATRNFYVDGKKPSHH
ncbi:adrenodoxin-like protein 1, mitochondrial Ferredoxin 1 [Dermatophagoides farinae]|uniref:adrenodoxin-like protein 1, mitochondrial Ferredoxin 1 n=1 Tax=Dermatophagoides farinae TaxID=6954 RepID=UPI003F633E4F